MGPTLPTLVLASEPRENVGNEFTVIDYPPERRQIKAGRPNSGRVPSLDALDDSYVASTRSGHLSWIGRTCLCSVQPCRRRDFCTPAPKQFALPYLTTQVPQPTFCLWAPNQTHCAPQKRPAGPKLGFCNRPQTAMQSSGTPRFPRHRHAGSTYTSKGRRRRPPTARSPPVSARSSQSPPNHRRPAAPS